MTKRIWWFFCASASALLGQAPSSCDAFNQVTVKIDAAGEIGAGVVIKSDGKTAWIATAAHVVTIAAKEADGHVFKERTPIRVTFSGNATKSFPATLQYPKPRSYSLSTLDVAVLEVVSASQDLPKAAVEHWRADELIQGEPLTYTGHPGELTWQCYKNTASTSRLSYQEDDRKFVFASPQVQPGVSGGPIFDRLGRLIGIVSSKEERGTNAIGIRISTVKRIMIDELAVKLGDTGNCSGANGCTTKLGQLKFITEYHDETPQGAMLTKSNEKVYQLPSDWPVGPYVHFVFSTMEYNSNLTSPNSRVTSQQMQQRIQQSNRAMPQIPIRGAFAATVRRGDADAAFFFMSAVASALVRGTDGHQYQIKLFKPESIEEISIELKVADGATTLDLK